MASLNEPPSIKQSRARKILTISNRHETPALLRLPREIRDLIYAELLIEPDLWDRRHQPECPHWHDDRDYWRKDYVPPILLHYPGAPLSGPNACERACIRRRHMSLLRVNRQISHEAIEFFYDNNTFTFTTAGDLAATLLSAPRAKLKKIQRLSLKSPGPDNRPSKRQSARMFAALDAVENLRMLELSYNFLSTSQSDIFALRALQIFRLAAVHAVGLEIAAMPEGIWNLVYLGFHWEYDMASCCRTERVAAASRRPWPARRVSDRCLACQYLWQAIESKSSAWSRGFVSGWDVVISPPEELVAHARAALVRMDPGHSSQAKYILDVKSDQDHEKVTVWGLHTESYATCERRRRKEAVAEKLAGLAPRGPRTQTLSSYDPNEDDGPVNKVKKSQRRHTPREVVEDKYPALQDRQEKRETEARVEAALRRGEKKALAELRQESKREVEAERMASRRRRGWRSGRANGIDEG